MSANPHTGVLDPSVCRVSVRKVKLSFSFAHRILIYILEFDGQMQHSLFYCDVLALSCPAKYQITVTSKTQKASAHMSGYKTAGRHKFLPA